MVEESLDLAEFGDKDMLRKAMDYMLSRYYKEDSKRRDIEDTEKFSWEARRRHTTQITYNDNITIIYTKNPVMKNILSIEARKIRQTSSRAIYIHIQMHKQTQGRKGHKYAMLGWYTCFWRMLWF